jgi:hypothetical protein
MVQDFEVDEEQHQRNDRIKPYTPSSPNGTSDCRRE